MDSSDKLTFNERLLFHLPIEQIQKNRDICNQRSNIIYGISTEREMVRQKLNKLVQELYRIWQKRLNAELSEKTCEIKIRKRESIRELEAVGSFYKQIRSGSEYYMRSAYNKILCSIYTVTVIRIF